MSDKRLDQLPVTPARVVAEEARRKGNEALGEDGYFNSETVILMGLCQIVAELREELEAIKRKP